MDESSLGETSVLIIDHGVPLPVRDNRHAYERQLAVYFILASTIFERLAFYSLAINLVVTLNSVELNWDSSTSTTASFIFFGTSYISTLIFAAISDAKLGRSKTIIIGFVLYLLSYIIIILIANTNTHQSICKGTSGTHTSVFSEHCGPQIIGTLIFMAIGVGAVQANMAVFGAEQIHESKITSRYFDKYYVAVNIGAIIAILSIPIIQTDLNDQTHSNNYFYGYLIAIFMLFAAALLFIIGRQYYIHTRPHDTIVTKCIPVIINAFQTWREHHKNKSKLGRIRTDSILRNLFSRQNTISQEGIIQNDERSLSFLDYAKATNNGKCLDRHVNDVKSLQRSIIVFLLLIPYWIIYYQVQITFPLQGQQMNIPFLSKDKKMPISWMSLGDSVTIIISVMILIKFVYKYMDIQNRTMIIKIKLIIGMILASLTMCIAGIIEIFRQKHCTKEKDDSDLSIFFQLPQNICMGLSEVFATVASLEFAYLAAPQSAQSLLMSLQFCSLGLSSFIGKAYLSMYSTTSNGLDFSCLSLNQWTFTTYFFILAGLQVAFIIVFVLCEKNFQILKLNPQQR
ncbi:unnamed protein product [Rotaria sordida]|uniref:Uncharacterized protein n=1 Tax=Rotaria sordida TaxID=392033 RepID=A0A814RRZ3_9BILA|nr:unnamed protein product [Rotaria sordida]CAF1491925.1 unnamed protein product [Rotaria sordida]CAF4074011.1 unnamed protein product [Rotaria sordida]CAF4094635.1 unnamed protein product [Rotaria sordida]